MKDTLPTLNFTDISRDTFLAEYWQKKPILLKQALPGFVNTLSAEELAGLSLEPEVESRIVLEQPDQTPGWQLKQGPFAETDYANLPSTHWTLLVQGVDRLLPEIQNLLDYFDFIPQWRVDDVMISYAALHGSVGPHFDHYDVFLLQAQGQRKWMLTTQDCDEENYLTDVELRVMKQFSIEQAFILEPGDILYLPPHVGHHGVSLSADCMTYSFGYRSYRGTEMLNSFCDYLSEHAEHSALYQDPDWRAMQQTSELPQAAWQQARQLLLSHLEEDTAFKNWFGQFATQLDESAQQRLPEMLEGVSESDFLALLQLHDVLLRDPVCKIAYQKATEDSGLQLFINGILWQIDGVSEALIKMIANHRSIECQNIQPLMANPYNSRFVTELWMLQMLQFSSNDELFFGTP